MKITKKLIALAVKNDACPAAIRWVEEHAGYTLAKLPIEYRRWVANHPSTPPEVLAALARDDDCYVRVWVARNLSAPPQVLTALARDANPYVRRGVSTHPSTPPKVLSGGGPGNADTGAPGAGREGGLLGRERKTNKRKGARHD